jgi:hypothetical protein
VGAAMARLAGDGINVEGMVGGCIAAHQQARRTGKMAVRSIGKPSSPVWALAQ